LYHVYCTCTIYVDATRCHIQWINMPLSLDEKYQWLASSTFEEATG
jgi:hypothetical protein